MNENSETPNERMALASSASPEAAGAGGSAPQRPRKRRRYRRPVRPKPAAGAEKNPALPITEVGDAGEPKLADPAGPVSSLPEDQSSWEGETGSVEPENKSQTENPAEAPAENAEASDAGTGAPGTVRKKHRHRGGRRHRRHRPEGPGAQPGAIPVPVVAAQVEIPTSASEPTPVPAPLPKPVPVQPAATVSEKREKPAAVRGDAVAPVSLKIPGLDAARAKVALVEFLQEQREIRGRAQAMMELSGELNSITTSVLLAEALGSDHVELYFFLDGELENQARREQARMVASRLGRQLEFKDLRPILEAVYAGESGVDASRRAERIIFEKQAWLLDLAEARNAMVVQSTNKTERLLTRSAGQVGEGRTVFPLGDVYQSQVVDLARACNIPAEVVNPTRDFPLAQELGLKTAEIDGLLYQMLDVKVSLARLMDLGLPEGKVHALYQKLRSAAQVRRSSAWESMGAYYIPRPWA